MSTVELILAIVEHERSIRKIIFGVHQKFQPKFHTMHFALNQWEMSQQHKHFELKPRIQNMHNLHIALLCGLCEVYTISHSYEK